MPHYPLQGEEKWRKTYRHLTAPRKQYAAFVSTMDEKIGRVLSYLDRFNLTEKTIVIFQSDHGHSVEVRTFGGGGSAGPYRGAKFSMFEGGIRIPAMISWPGHLPENEIRTQLATGCDWFPTIAELCRVKLPKRKLDGKSIVPVLKSATVPSQHKWFHWQLGNGPRAQWAVREDHWKLIGNPRDPVHKNSLGPNNKLFLVDLEKDIGEKTNIAKDHADVVKRLKKRHNLWKHDVLHN